LSVFAKTHHVSLRQAGLMGFRSGATAPMLNPSYGFGVFAKIRMVAIDAISDNTVATLNSVP
jgi:hypothetical protein